MRRHSVAEFSHTVSLKNERENLELQRTMSHLALARRQSLQSSETEILKVKLKAKKLNLNVVDYTERKQGLNYMFEDAERNDSEGVERQRQSSRMSIRRHSCSSDQGLTMSSNERHVSFQKDKVQEMDKVQGMDNPKIQRAVSETGRATSGSTSNFRPPSRSRSLSIDFLHQGKPVSYPKTKEMMVNSYTRNNSESKTSRTPSLHKQLSLDFDAYRPSSVSYNDMQSPYKVLHCIGKRTVSALDRRDSSVSFRTRKFLVTPRKQSRPRTAQNSNTF